MQSAEERKRQDKVVFKTCIITNFLYFAIHVIYLIFFLITKTYALVYFNIGNVIFYLSLFLIIKYKQYLLYARLCGLEIMTYMCYATILCGFEPGFHLCLIGLCIIAFYTTYFSKQARENKKAAIWTIFSMLVYIALYLICSFTDRMYNLEKWANITLFVAHAAIVFLFIGVYLLAFTNYALKLEERITKESRLDKLTQLPNRHALYDYLEDIEDKNGYSLSIFDIDNFKKVNDKYGHVCGDYILRKLSDIVKDELKDSFVCRYGGEEFIVISKKDDDNLKSYIDSARKKVEEYSFIFDNNKIKITITIGVAKYTEGLLDNKWIDNADEKLYIGKNNGKNQIVL